MAPPWIVRSILALLALEAGICTAFLADYWQPLHRRETSVFRSFLGATRDDSNFVIDPTPASSRTRIIRPLESGAPKAYARIDITDDPDRIFESNPPSPTDWAAILDTTHKLNLSVVAINHPLSWENAGEIPLRLLDHQISRFDRAVLCVDLHRSPNAQALPLFLKRNAIPLRNVTGNASNLPRVNRIVLPPSATSAPNAIFAFRVLENEVTLNPDGSPQPSPAHTFARWDKSLVPSFPIALAMAQFKVEPNDIRIVLGKHIRLGDGPIIPIDEFGQLKVPLIKPIGIPFATAEAIETDSGAATDILSAGVPDCALFTEAKPTAATSWHSSAHLLRVLTSVESLPRPGAAAPHPRLPLWAELLVLATIAGLGALFLTFTPFNRLLAFGLLALGSLIFLAGLLDLSPTHLWTPITPVLATVLAGGLLSRRMHHEIRRKVSLNPNVIK